MLMKLESGRFKCKEQLAWGSKNVLTPVGEVENQQTHVRCKVKKTKGNSKWVILEFPLEEYHGSRFGKDTCGAPNVLGVPCQHMVAAMKSGEIPGLNKDNMMPYW